MYGNGTAVQQHISIMMGDMWGVCSVVYITLSRAAQCQVWLVHGMVVTWWGIWPRG